MKEQMCECCDDNPATGAPGRPWLDYLCEGCASGTDCARCSQIWPPDPVTGGGSNLR